MCIRDRVISASVKEFAIRKLDKCISSVDCKQINKLNIQSCTLILIIEGIFMLLKLRLINNK